MFAARDGQTGWAVVLPTGNVVVQIGAHITEQVAWRVALGWPSAGEVRDAKARGAYAFPCRLQELAREPGREH